MFLNKVKTFLRLSVLVNGPFKNLDLGSCFFFNINPELVTNITVDLFLYIWR